MLWFNDKNIVNISFVRRDERTGKLSASASVSNKRVDGTREWFSLPARFSSTAAAKFMALPPLAEGERVSLTVTSGGVELYASQKYKNEKNKPLTMCSLMINDFEVKTWDDAPSAPGQAEAAHARSPILPGEAPLPWEEPQADNDANPFM